MNKVLLLTFALMVSATMAFAQNGSIGIFADNAGTSYNLPGAPGLAYYYFVHCYALGATRSQWAAPAPTCMTAVRIADMPVFAVNLGNTAAGITIGYGTCKTGTFHIMTTLYNVVSAETCCRWDVVADPSLASGKIEIQDCEFDLTYGNGGHGWVNWTPACHEVPTEDTTWGQVKALYTE